MMAAFGKIQRTRFKPFYGNQQQHDTEGDFELAGGEFVRGFDAERGKIMVAMLRMATAGR